MLDYVHVCCSPSTESTTKGTRLEERRQEDWGGGGGGGGVGGVRAHTSHSISMRAQLLLGWVTQRVQR